MGQNDTTLRGTAGGVLRLQETDSGLLVATMQGHFGTDLLPRYKEALARAVKAGDAIGFHDWEKMTTYDSACRHEMTDWTIAHRKEIRGWHILVRSKLVAMGVATASLIIGGGVISSYSDRKRFEDTLAPFLPNLAGGAESLPRRDAR